MLDPLLLERLAAGETLLTGNVRLAQTLTRAYHQARHEQGESVWESPDILSWQAWLGRAFSEARVAHAGLTPATLLNDAQEQMLWEQVVIELEGRERLLQIHAAARQAREAWRTVQAWRLPWPFPAALLSEDSRAFSAWAAAFHARCHDARLLEPARLADALAGAWREQPPSPAPRLILAGFDELTPRQHSLLRVIENAGGAVEMLEAPSRANQAVSLACDDRAGEYLLAARWARARLQDRPGARIGVIVPELQSRLGEIERVFEAVMTPGASSPAGALPFNISLGRPLAAQPLVADALLLLDMSSRTTRWPLEELSRLLRSPFILAGTSEAAARAILDVELRETGHAEISLNPLITRLSRNGRCASFTAMLLAWRGALDKLPTRQSFGRWSMELNGLLKQLGWPGERPIDSHEHQAMQAWGDVLAGMARLDAVSGQVGLNEAVARLRALAAERVFQPESAPAPVQIMGVLEAAGQSFDYLWISGLHDGVWPPPPRPNPFIPYRLQREYGVPHASAERELDFTQRVTRRLLASAPELVLSYPLREGEQDLSPSGLLAEIAAARPEQLACWPDALYSDVLIGAATLESFDDPKGPALARDELAEGGVGLFKAQSQCPFQAFARYRLHARPLSWPEPGLDAAERGSLVHGVLQYFWSQTGDHASLCALDADRLGELVEWAANRALREHRRLPLDSPLPPLLNVERQRLTRLALDWLQIEKQRAPFQVAAVEQNQSCGVGGIRISGRVDRLDRLGNGDLLLIDYKTGRCNPRHWFDTRPEEPQLPLYAVTAPQAVNGVAYAQLRPGDMRLQGVADQEGIASGIKAVEDGKQIEGVVDWACLLEHWRGVLNTLGEEYRAGYAEVAPLAYPRTCAYCPYGNFCRIDERNGMLVNGEQEAAAND